VTEHGQGPSTIVFLHAFPLSSLMWRPQLDALPPGWRGLAPDFRGLGKSGRGEPPARTVADHARDVWALVDALAPGPVVLAGLSMGGYVAFECWRQRPDGVRGLVLADTRAEPDTEEARAKRTAMQEKARQGGPGAVLDAMFPGLLGATTQTHDPHRAVEVREFAAGASTEGVVDALDTLRTRPDSRPDLARIGCPALVLVGAEDTLTPPEAARTMADGIAGATLVTIPAAGHLANIEQPKAFTRALVDWLDRRFAGN
ncbi:MAG TPA: alpha/beta fold hydrolase, partial [Luteitalea sp.]|nr:alpha/beta fold hydrolase [Luteitalea sp.]